MQKLDNMRGFRDVKAYQLACTLAMEIFEESKSFPLKERFSVTDQIRKSSRSVPGNIAEGYRKRMYPKMFVSKLADSDAEAAETRVWLDFAFDCGYITKTGCDKLMDAFDQVGKMLGSMIAHPEKFISS